MSTPPVVGRLAPSPTGAQHIGNARTYLVAWLAARSRTGRLILRLEDIDSPRIKAGADQQALDDLRWLGLDWDAGPDIGGPEAPYRQTQRLERYRAALDQLKAAELVYPCSCSRSDVLAAASAPHQGDEGPIYPGTCTKNTASVAERLGDTSYCWRFRASNILRQFQDQLAGPQSLCVRQQLGDFVVQKADCSPAYQLAVVVDDHAMQVTEVVRGDDLIASTFRQLELYASFGWQPPKFAHIPLVVGPDGRRLAKRHGDSRLSVLRERGCRPERLIGLLAWSCGWIERPRPLAAAELIPLFRLATIPARPFVFTPQMWNELLLEK